MDETLLLDRQLCFALYAASRAMTGAYQPLLERLGVTYPQYLVLLVLWEQDGIRVSHLGDRLHLDSGTLTPLLKRLEAQGTVERRRSQTDERVVEIYLTPSGHALRDQARDIPTQLFCSLGTNADDFTRLRDQLRALTDTVQNASKESL